MRKRRTFSCGCSALFQAGEEAVTLDLLPLILKVIAQENRLEEEMFLTTFLWEEAKHTDFFNRFFVEVAGSPTDLGRYHSDSYRTLFYEALPAAINRLLVRPSPRGADPRFGDLQHGDRGRTGRDRLSRLLHRSAAQ